jgi:hypothetical protein
MTPKIGPALGIAIPNARNPHEAVRFATWLRPKCSQPYFEDITLPVWSMKKLVKAVKDSEKEIDELFPREGIGLKNPNYRYHISFAYRAGIWLLLALNYIESDYLHKWTRNHRRYDGFVRWTRAQHPNRTHQTHPPIPLTNVSVHNDGGD